MVATRSASPFSIPERHDGTRGAFGCVALTRAQAGHVGVTARLPDLCNAPYRPGAGQRFDLRVRPAGPPVRMPHRLDRQGDCVRWSQRRMFDSGHFDAAPAPRMLSCKRRAGAPVPALCRRLPILIPPARSSALRLDLRRGAGRLISEWHPPRPAIRSCCIGVRTGVGTMACRGSPTLGPPILLPC